jgi:signal transduction histidine kinase
MVGQRNTIFASTEPERLTAELRRREAYSAEAQRLSHTGSFGWSVPSGELTWSDETFRIYEYDRAVRPTLERVMVRIHPDDRSWAKEAIRRSTANRTDFDIQHRLQMPDDRIKDIRVVAQAVEDAHGGLEFVGAVMDVTATRRLVDAASLVSAERKMAQELVRSREEEQRRLARELHDCTAQGLASVALNLAVVQASKKTLDRRAKRALADAIAATDQCLAEIRTIAHLRHPPLLDEFGLRSALVKYVEGFVRRSGIQVDLDIPGDLGELPQEVEITLFRIVQEALTNVRRHAQSSQASIQIRREGNEISMDVRDAGRGMTESDQSPLGIGVGIPSMRQRVQHIGGRMEIHSHKDGTTVRVMIPLE